jgi:NADH-quinone oxidoreductase subunit F
MVFDDTVDLTDVLARITEFFAHESCGKCYLCQMGTQRQAELICRIRNGQEQPGDVDTLLKLGQVMSNGSNCGLGQAANWAVANAVKHWPELFTPKILE